MHRKRILNVLKSVNNSKPRKTIIIEDKHYITVAGDN